VANTEDVNDPVESRDENKKQAPQNSNAAKINDSDGKASLVVQGAVVVMVGKKPVTEMLQRGAMADWGSKWANNPDYQGQSATARG
jgi:hypothetical protein